MRYGKLFLQLLLIILIFGCTSAPRQISFIPDWYTNPPADNNDSLYFALSAKGTSVEEVEKKGGEALYREIVSRIGISEEDSLCDDFAEFRNGIIQIVKEVNIPGFTLIEKYVDDQNREFIIYVLVELTREKLSQTGSDLLDILKAGTTVSIFTDDAERFIENGDLYNGVLSYIKAAQESAESGNKFIIESSLTSAIELLKKIDIIKISSPETIAVGENGVFSASMKLKEENRSVVWNNISIKVTFRDRKKGAVIGERFAFLRTDEKGFITFVHPPPGYTGMGRVEIELDLFRDSEPFDPLEENYSDLVQKLKESVGSIDVIFDFEIISSAPDVETGIFIVDSDFLKKPLETVNTAMGLYENLVDRGFSVSILNINRNKLQELTEKEFLRDISYMVDPAIKRVIYGMARITDFDDSGGGFSVVTEVEINVVDLDSGEIIFSETMSKRVQGGESQSTINTSFKELGKSLSLMLIDKLP